MSLLDTVKSLMPSHWTAEDTSTFGIILSCPEGAVTIDERLRNFESGCAVVRGRGKYKGAKWKAELAADAVARLKEHEDYWTAIRANAAKKP